MILRIGPLEIAVPAVQVIIGEARGAEKPDPFFAVHIADLLKQAAVFQQLDDDALAAAQRLHLRQHLVELALERRGEILPRALENPADPGERQAGLAVEPDLAQAPVVPVRVIPIAVAQPAAGLEQPDAVVIEQGGARKAVFPAQLADRHGRSIFPVAR